METAEEFLEHYGVKGMRWGVRRGGNRVSTGRTTYKKTPNRLSDDELNRRIKRMELEKKYKDLNSPAQSAGRKYVQTILESSGKTAAGAIVGGVVTFAVQRALKKKFGS